MSATTAAPSARSQHFWFIVALAILAAQVLSEHLMGRLWICSCGTIKLFEPGVNTPGNSQHLFDWYTPSHIIHGFLFYLLGWAVLRKASIGARSSASASSGRRSGS